ncbi:hypothetical protein J4468_00340 [Candidatus Woesearchaeota archaeon]|nr:hypothetical protein [Candidatus Woesearchaeota archaeon]
MDLIQQLKQEHIEILRLFEGMDLRLLKETIITHLELENNLLYPALAKCKEKEPKELSLKFSKEMIGISKKTLVFFGKYEKINVLKLRKDVEFNKGLAERIMEIKKRFAIEESILFPAYEKYVRG